MGVGQKGDSSRATRLVIIFVALQTVLTLKLISSTEAHIPEGVPLSRMKDERRYDYSFINMLGGGK